MLSLVYVFDIEQLLGAGGLIGVLIVAAIVFIESGLLVGFFLPGDTLLFGAGLLASQGELPILPLIIATVFAAILGDNVGYMIGQRTGPRLFKQKDGILFRQEHIRMAEAFYKKHGGKTIILARFTPIVRTFAPVVAGVGNMPRRRFIFFNVIGGIGWGAGMTLLGYSLGSRIPGLDHYIEYVLVGVVLATLGLSSFHIFKDPVTRKLLLKKIVQSVRSTTTRKPSK